MKILYDFQAFFWQKYGGVSNCFVQLIKNLPCSVDYEVGLCESDNIHLRDSGILNVSPCLNPADKFITDKHFYGQGNLYKLYSQIFPRYTSFGRNKLCSINAIKQGDFDVFHPTSFDNYFLKYLNGKPFVITVHDMIPELFCGKRKEETINSVKATLCRDAAHIVVVSENTKKDLINILNIPEEKITVIYHGAPNSVGTSSQKPIIKGKYILYVGGRGGYKKFSLMIKSIKDVLKRHRELSIVCTGEEFKRQEIELFKDLGIAERMIHYHPTDTELLNIYANAECFIFSSVYEGFGIPILEAYQAQCPVLLNHKSCFPEIAQDAALYFNLDDNQSDLETVLESFFQMDTIEKEQLIKKQTDRLHFFSWLDSARKLAEVYKEVYEMTK